MSDDKELRSSDNADGKEALGEAAGAEVAAEGEGRKDVEGHAEVLEEGKPVGEAIGATTPERTRAQRDEAQGLTETTTEYQPEQEVITEEAVVTEKLDVPLVKESTSSEEEKKVEAGESGPMLRREVIPLKGEDEEDGRPSGTYARSSRRRSGSRGSLRSLSERKSIGGGSTHSIHSNSGSQEPSKKLPSNFANPRFSITAPNGDQAELKMDEDAPPVPLIPPNSEPPPQKDKKEVLKPPRLELPNSSFNQIKKGMETPDTSKTPFTIRKTKLTLFTKQIPLPRWQQTLQEFRTILRILHFGLAIAAFTSLAAGTFSADFKSAIMSKSGINYMSFTSVTSAFVSFACLVVYFFPSNLNISPHRHPRFSRVEVGIDIICAGLWIAACMALIAFGLCPAELFPESSKCYKWNLTLAFGFTCFSSYVVTIAMGFYDLKTHGWGSDCEWRPVGARGGWKIGPGEDPFDDFD
ncbi:hypothetical protein HDU97_008618 [Phlyctochytrium planicorne]|nr:hypothetical protein HDU97_008618 [Phlyctochytrium planicorne]